MSVNVCNDRHLAPSARASALRGRSSPKLRQRRRIAEQIRRRKRNVFSLGKARARYLNMHEKAALSSSRACRQPVISIYCPRCRRSVFTERNVIYKNVFSFRFNKNEESGIENNL